MDKALIAAGLRVAIEEARNGLEEGGIPIGAALFKGDQLISRGRNKRIQNKSQILHGEIDCIENAGRRNDLSKMTLFTTLSPCMMCCGTIIQFRIPIVVIGDAKTFGGNENFLRDRGVFIIVVNDQECAQLMADFLRNKNNEALWNEDIGVT